jgi:acetyl esterase/lipase
MRLSRGALLALVAVIAVILVGAVLLHSPAFHSHMAGLHGGAGIHGGGPASSVIGDAGGDPAANARARAGVAALGKRWDMETFAQTVALYTEVHRGIEWPGVLAPETIRYGADAEQTLDLYVPEQGFSEPGPVFVFVHGNGLGNSESIAPGSDGLIYSHLGKLAATAGGIGISMNYRYRSSDTEMSALETAAEDLRLVLEWIVGHISPYGGDPGTIVVVGNAEGATVTAAYLFNAAWQMPAGPGIAAAILSSGDFGDRAPEIGRFLRDYAGERVPLALWYGEFDTPEIGAGVQSLHDRLCSRYDECPWLEQIPGHNRVSQIMSLGTADTDVMNRFIRFYHTVR